MLWRWRFALQGNENTRVWKAKWLERPQVTNRIITEKKNGGCSSLKLKTSCCKVKISSREYCKVLGMTKKKWGKTRKKWTEYIYIYRYIPRHLSRVCCARNWRGPERSRGRFIRSRRPWKCNAKSCKSVGWDQEPKKKFFLLFFSFSALVCAQHTRGGRNIVCETHRGPLLQCRAARIFKAK